MSKGQYHGAAGVLVHLQRRSARQFVMTTANVGDVEVVLCRRDEAICLTRKFVTSADRTECQRVCKLDGFITVASSVWLTRLPEHCIHPKNFASDFVAAV